jgi:cob(I)alamin adenosyltransferase
MTDRLTRIVTRSGDKGMSGLANGDRVGKDSPRMRALGEVDELNSMLGLLLAEDMPASVREVLLTVQHDLFDLGGELSLPERAILTADHVSRLEDEVEDFNASLPPLREFVLPGGSRAAALCHVCRSVCRRAERAVVALAQGEMLSASLLQYVNRLSDLLFVLTRALNQAQGVPETIWNRNR